MNLLLVDDDKVNSDLIKMLLEMDGFSVQLAPTLEQARTQLTAVDDLQAIIIDCNLAGGANGLELAEEIRQGETAAPSDLIIIATSGDDRRAAEAQAAGATQFYLKPYSLNDFSANLQALLQNK